VFTKHNKLRFHRRQISALQHTARVPAACNMSFVCGTLCHSFSRVINEACRLTYSEGSPRLMTRSCCNQKLISWKTQESLFPAVIQSYNLSDDFFMRRTWNGISDRRNFMRIYKFKLQ
jgi:hypothetical protein